MALVRMLYVSDAQGCADREAVEELVDSIRATSLARNLRLGLTGALAYSEISFAQAIEGAPERVDDVFASICRDKRHANVTLIDRREVSARVFPDWAMAFAPLAPGASLRNLSAENLTRTLIAAANELNGVRAIHGFGAAATAPMRVVG